MNVTFVKRFLLECDAIYSGMEAPSFWSDRRSPEDSIMPQGTKNFVVIAVRTLYLTHTCFCNTSKCTRFIYAYNLSHGCFMFDALVSELHKRLCAKIINECICCHSELFSSPNPQNKQCKRHFFVCIVSHLQT